MPEVLAECTGVRRAFGRFTAVDGVNLTVASGEVVGLLGANGTGKTTLIRLLLGLLPPSGGAVRLFGQPPSRASRRRVGYLPDVLLLDEPTSGVDPLARARLWETTAQIIGPARTAVVRAADWAGALGRLERSGLRAVLSGTALRVPARPAAEVAAALGDLPAETSTGPATLEERFFGLVTDG